jgi:Kef-type K+ transport system membrane component KefB
MSESQWTLSEFGLSAFAAVIGFSVGAKAVAAIQQQGVALLIAVAFVTLIPMIVALLRYNFLDFCRDSSPPRDAGFRPSWATRKGCKSP